MRNRKASLVHYFFSGSQSLDEVAATMMVCHDQFSVTITHEIRQDEERKQREQLRDEQNAAYLESLAADRAKEEQRKREEQEKQAVEKRQKEEQYSKLCVICRPTPSD